MSFKFSSITNSFIAGIHPALGSLENSYMPMSHELSTDSHYFGPGLFRIHYKVHGLNYNPGTDYLEFMTMCSLEGTTYLTHSIQSDSEGWVVMPFEFYTKLIITFNSRAKVIAYRYVELDVVETVCKYSPYALTAINFYSEQHRLNEVVNKGWYVPVQGNTADPENKLLITYDGSEPTFDNPCSNSFTQLNYNGAMQWYVNLSVTSFVTAWLRHYHYGTTAMREGSGFIPYAVTDILAKFGPPIQPVYTHNPSVEDFRLGGLCGDWYTPQETLHPWFFTAEGLRTPLGTATVYISTSVTNVIGKSIRINYKVVMGPRGVFGGQVSLTALSVPFAPENFSTTPVLFDTSSAGDKQLVITLSSTMATVMFRYKPAVSGFYLDDEQAYVVITSMEYVDRPRTIVNDYSTVPRIEDWSKGKLDKPWTYTGSWNYWTPVIPENDYMLASPVMDDSDWAEISFTVDCIDGYIYFVWASESEQEYDYLRFYLDGVEKRAVTGRIMAHSVGVPVTLGTHTFTWQYQTDSSYTVEGNRGLLGTIRFPTVDNKVFNHDSSQLSPVYTSSIDGVTGSEPWYWVPVNELNVNPTGLYCVGNSSEVQTLAIECPVGSGQLVVDMNYQFIGDGNAYLYGEGRVSVVGRCDWSGSQLFSTTLYVCGAYPQIDEGNYISGNAPLPLPTSGTGTIYIDVIGNSSNVSGIMIFISKIILPVATTEMISIAPTDDIVAFPIECTLDSQDASQELYYTLDGTEPEISPSRLKYTGPIALTEPKIVRYAPYSADYGYGKPDLKYYLDKRLTSVRMLHHRYTYMGANYIRLYSTSWDTPIVYGVISSTQVFQPVVYGEQPIHVTPDMQAIVFGILTRRFTSANLMGNVSRRSKFTYDVDYSTLEVVQLNDAILPSDWPKAVEAALAVNKDAFSFIPTVLPSSPAGAYYSGRRLSLRSNFSGPIKYSIDSPALDLTYTEELVIDSSCTVYARAEESDVDGPIQSFTYSILSGKGGHGIKLAHMGHAAMPQKQLTSSLQCNSVLKSQDLASKKCAVAYSDLLDTFMQLSYEEYAGYIMENTVYTLFADEEMTMPFPFVFTLMVNPGEYFSIPDSYAAVYKSDARTTSFEQDGLICRFTDELASDSEVKIISDYCLRLCVDVVKTTRPSVVTQVWTNIPAGNYLSTKSDAVLLSADGLTFTKVITLKSNTLYIKGSLPEDVEYGYNKIDVVIKLATCEAIDEYSI